METQKEIGARLLHARKKKKMSRAALGRLLGLHETTIKRYEDGDIKTIDVKKLKEFASALEIDAATLAGIHHPEAFQIQMPAGMKQEELPPEAMEELRILQEYIITKYKKQMKD